MSLSAIANGRDGPAPSSNDCPEGSSHVIPFSRTTLDSFIPILRYLPGLHLDQNLYYIHGPIATNDWARLRDYALTVSKFILMDIMNENSEALISPSAFFRLALSQEPEKAFFPHLSDLVIVDADASLSYLELLLTPSLKSLEVLRVPDSQQPTLSSFLITLVQVTPLLQTLIFGPGQFLSNSIHTVLQFRNLRQLELKDAVSEMNSAFFESLGSLPVLESLILDAGFCEYVSSTTTTDGKSDKEPPQNDISDTGDAFNQLMKLHVIGSPLLLEDLVAQITSTRLEDVSITVACLPYEELEIKREAKKGKQTVSIVQTRDPKTEKVYEGKKKKKKKKGEKGEKEKERQRRLPYEELEIQREVEKAKQTVSIVQTRNRETEKVDEGKKEEGILEEEVRRLNNLEGESEEERRLKAIKESKHWKERERSLLANVYNNTPFVALLRLLPSRWSASLKTVSVSTFGCSPQQALIPPTLLKEAFRTLLLHPTIENLIVKGWTLDSVEDSILCLAELAPSNLKGLFLPLDETNSGISLSTLRHIAITCPKLESLQCRIKPLSLIPEYTVPTTGTEALFHGLRTLSVGNSSPHPDSKKLYLIARHLDLLFPHLETINTSEEHNGEQWVVVNELVKMCQTARMDERYRASIMPT
ncbi:hypothetical protein BYT27DRAFT_7146823 [Phlegmacium glaucopus]|nr:hypothetical protein BYT27DRAFT_7146823 [Phlegmacium glaucopus]